MSQPGGVSALPSGRGPTTVVYVVPNGAASIITRARDVLVIGTDSGSPIEPPPPSTVTLPAEPVAGDRVVIKRTALPSVVVQCGGTMTIEGVVPSLTLESAGGLDTLELEADPARDAWRIVSTWDAGAFESDPFGELYRLQSTTVFSFVDETPVPIDGTGGGWGQSSTGSGIDPDPATGTIGCDGQGQFRASYTVNIRPSQDVAICTARLETRNDGGAWGARSDSYSEVRFGDPALALTAAVPPLVGSTQFGADVGELVEVRLVLMAQGGFDFDAQVYYANFAVEKL